MTYKEEVQARMNAAKTAEPTSSYATEVKQRMDMAKAQKAAEATRKLSIQMAEDKEYKEMMDPTAGMGMMEKLGVGAISGLKNVMEGIGNLGKDELKLVSDEQIMERKYLEEHGTTPLGAAMAQERLKDRGGFESQGIMQTTEGSIGQFGGEMLALAPLGAVAKPVQAAHKLYKGASVLPTAQKVLRGTTAAIEGGASGAILANPNERGTGAAQGATAGLMLNKAMSGLSRVFKDGLVRQKSASIGLKDMVEKQTGKRPFVPLTQAADVVADAPTAKAKSTADIISLLPSAKAKMERQAGELVTDVYEANIRQVFPKTADAGVKVLRDSGDMQAALEAAKNAKGFKRSQQVFSPTQEILDQAARSSTTGSYTPKQLIRASKAFAGEGDIAYSPFRKTGIMMDEVLGGDLGKSTVAAREGVRQLGDSLGGLVGLSGALVDKIPMLGEMLASKSVQNFLMGEGGAGLQQALRKAMQTGTGKEIREVMSAIRRAMSAQVAQDDVALGYDNPQAYAKQVGSSLRSGAESVQEYFTGE